LTNVQNSFTAWHAHHSSVNLQAMTKDPRRYENTVEKPIISASIGPTEY